ncbi:MAG: RluA family pseudouridine synthase [Clostridia bacterium]|nr:RluA family pseudouridine synthase [Clostridia bacterium]
MSQKEFVCETAGDRLDTKLSLCLEISRSAAANLIEQGLVTVNGKPCAKNLRLKEGDCVVATLPQVRSAEAIAQNIPLNIVYEDDSLLVVNKPKGMVVHPAAGNYEGTLVNALLYHCPDSLSGINGVARPGIVHRIDKDTSGLLMVAKNDAAHNCLAKQVKDHTVCREYEAIVRGHLKEQKGTIDAPIGRHPIKRKQMTVTDKNARNAVTHYEVVAEYKEYTHVRLRLETGRTHQIRVHMSYIGHPVAGDSVYGGSRQPKGLQGQCLHARKLGFVHPKTQEYMEFTSELPEYFTEFLKRLD